MSERLERFAITVLRNFFFRRFFRRDFGIFGIVCIGSFYAANKAGLEALPLFNQLFHTFGINVMSSRQSLQVARLAPGIRANASGPLSRGSAVYFGCSARGGSSP